MMRPSRLLPLVGGLALLTAACSESPTATLPLDCESEHPTLEVGSSISAAITADDSQLEDGTFYDFYSLPVEAATTVTIRMTSPEIDPFLFLLQENEQPVAQNNDAPGGTTTDAEIVQSLTRGCYLVVANTLESETGNYTLAVTED